LHSDDKPLASPSFNPLLKICIDSTDFKTLINSSFTGELRNINISYPDLAESDIRVTASFDGLKSINPRASVSFII
jgi:hypothetical protein